MSSAFTRYNMYPKGHLEIVEVFEDDSSPRHLVKVEYAGGYALAILTNKMLIDAKKQGDGYSYSFDVLLSDLSEDTLEWLNLKLETHPFHVNEFRVTIENWEVIAKEISHVLRSKVELLEQKRSVLKNSLTLYSNRREELQRLKAERQAIKDEKRKRAEENKKPKSDKVVSTKGYVYVLKVLNEDDVYKIGRTKNPDNRLRTFNVKLPFAVEYEFLIETDNMYALEAELHERFKDQRLRGSEFFKLTNNDIESIQHGSTPRTRTPRQP